MAYDDTSFYGDLIVDEYDDKCNFIGTNTSAGFYAYHILGDSFDLMSSQCSQFLNDSSILSADPSSLDSFWGLSYNMPRPTLPISYSLIFRDDGLINSYTDWVNNGNRATVIRDDECTKFYYETLNGNGNITLQARPSNTEYWITSTDFVVEFDIVELSTERNQRIQIGNSSSQANLYLYGSRGFASNQHIKFVVENQTITTYIDGVQTGDTYSFSGSGDCRVIYQAFSVGAYLKFKNFRIFDMTTTSERLMTDDEYRVYLYLRNCRLLTREDIEINMNKAFATDDFSIYFSEESNFLAVTDHLTYTPTTTATSNIAKNSNDTSNDYIVNLGSEDSNVHHLGGNLATTEDVVQVINIPYNDWDSDFLAFLEQYISVKGNLKIREYNL